MFLTIINALFPVAFVIFLGWIAGRFKIIDPNQSSHFATYVMSFSFPCLLFIITATTKLSVLLDVRFVAAFAIGLMGTFVISFFIHKHIMKRNAHESGQAAFVCSFPDMAFMGIPIFIELLGSKALISIVVGNIITSVIMIPVVIILLESKNENKANILKKTFLQIILVFKKPLIFAPIAGVLYALIGVPLPNVVEHSLKLIGETTSGVSLFALGLIMSGFALKLSRGVFLNIGIKNILQPLIMLGLVVLFGITGIMSVELVLLCAMPTATMTTMFAIRYQALTEESTSSAILGTIFSLVTLTIFMLIMGI